MKPTKGACGVVGDPVMESGDWRAQLQRERTVNKIIDTLKSRLQLSGYERQQELKKIAERVEQEIYTTATSQSEYARKICLAILIIEIRLQTLMQSNSAANTVNHSVPLDSTAQTCKIDGGDCQEEFYQKIKDLLDSRPTQCSSGIVGDTTMESGDWRDQLQADSRERIKNRIMNTLTRHLPFSRHEELQEVKKIAERVEEEIYTGVTNLSEYARLLCLIMLTMKTRFRNLMSDSMQSNSAANSVNPSNTGSQVMQQVNNQGQQLPIPVSSNNIQQMTSQSMCSNIGSTGMQGSSGLSSALPPGSALQQLTTTEVSGQNSNLQNIKKRARQNQLTIQQQKLIGQQNKLSSLRQPSSQQLIGQSTMTDVAGQNLKMQNIQNMSTVKGTLQSNKMPIQQHNRQGLAALLPTQVQQSQPQLQQQNVIDQHKLLFQQQKTVPQASTTSFDSTAQNGNPNDGDWQEEVYQKIKAMKDLYLLDLNEIQQQFLSKQQPKNEQHEKLKVFKNKLERSIQFLQTPKHEILANYKDKLGIYEMYIITVISTYRRKLAAPQQQAQPLPLLHMKSLQQTQQTHSQLIPVQSHKIQMKSQGSMAQMLQSNKVPIQQQNQQSSANLLPTQVQQSQLQSEQLADMQQRLATEASSTLLNKLPKKLLDPGSFTIPCSIGELSVSNALADTGAGMSLMPYSMFKRLSLGEPIPTKMRIRLADRSLRNPRGIAKNLLVKVGKFVFPTDFVILDMEEDQKVPLKLILGRPFLATSRAMIDMGDGRLTLRVGEEELKFGVGQRVNKVSMHFVEAN